MNPTRTAPFFKDRIGLIILLACFVVLKIPHLHFPFYWDECWPYASGIRRMYDAGPTLLPGVLDPEYSRGHPLLFSFLASSWMKLFGVSHIAMHSFSLTVAAMGIIAVYEGALRFFNRNVALMASSLIAFQVVFFVQSSFLLPEVMLAVLCFTSFCLYAAQKYGLACISITLLLLVKESAVIAGLVLAGDAAWRLLRRDLLWKERLAALAATTFPFMVLAAFFLLQYQREGWLIFPVHEHLIETGPAVVLEKLRNCFDILFTHDLRQYYLLVLMVLIIIVAVSQKSLKKAFRNDDPAWRTDVKARRLLRLFLVFIPLFFIFSALNMLIARYLIITLLPAILLLSVLSIRYAERIHPAAVYVVFIIMAGITVTAFCKDKGINDRNLGAFDAMTVQQQIVNCLEQQDRYDNVISSNAYLERMHLTDAYTGFLRSAKTFPHVQTAVDEHTDLVIFTNIEPDASYDQFKNNHGFKLLYRTEKGEAWGEIYERIR